MFSSNELFDAIKSDDLNGAVQLWRESAGEGIFLFQDMTPLLYCSYQRRFHIADALIEAGMEPDLFESVALGRLKDFHMNLARHPDLDLRSSDGWTALHLASFFGNLEMAEELIRRGAGVQVVSENNQKNYALHAAIAGHGSLQIVELLLHSGANVQAAAADDITALHIAASRGSVQLLSRLFEAGAVEKPMKDGRFPWNLAKERGHEACLHLFSVQPN